MKKIWLTLLEGAGATQTTTTNLVNNTPQKIVIPRNNQEPKKNGLASLATRATTAIGSGAGLISLYAPLQIYSLNTEIALLERKEQPVPLALLTKCDSLFAL